MNNVFLQAIASGFIRASECPEWKDSVSPFGEETIWQIDIPGINPRRIIVEHHVDDNFLTVRWPNKDFSMKGFIFKVPHDTDDIGVCVSLGILTINFTHHQKIVNILKVNII